MPVDLSDVVVEPVVVVVVVVVVDDETEVGFQQRNRDPSCYRS